MLKKIRINTINRTISKTVILGIFTLIAIFHISCNEQTKTDNVNTIEKADKIDELISTYAEYGKFNGSVLVAEKGKIIYKKGFGLANMEWDIPNQPDTKFRIASITKLFTAMLIVQLAAEKKLDLHAPISTYLPDYPKSNGDLITVDHLRNHTSGIINFTDIPGLRMEQRYHNHEEIMALFADSVLQFTPGEKYAYSNSGYYVLGVIIEKVTGKSYEQVLQDRILSPLKMNNSGYDHHRTILKNRATGYNMEWNHSYLVNSNYIDMSIPFSAGAMYSTVEDLFLFDQALYSEKLLSKEYMDILYDTKDDYWEMPIGNTEDKVLINGHEGGIDGFNTLLTRIPSNRSTIILFNNTYWAPLREMTHAINGILYDKPYDFPKKSIAMSLFDVIEKEDVTAALLYYNEVKDINQYDLSEKEMNQVGYQLFNSDRLNEAAFIFKLNVEAFPDSFNVYDSYGEVLMALGNKKEAIENYKKSVQLNPDNENGIKILKELGVDIKKDILNLLETDATWKKEIFNFPISFAKEINYQGFEEAQFPEGWRKKDSPDFWSYVFAWNVNGNIELKENELETNLQIYFDGLMKVVNKDKEIVIPNTIAQFRKKGDSNNISSYIGKVEIFDAFVTKEPMTLNVLVEKYYCELKKKSIILFRFSPKDFESDVWLKLKRVKLRDDFCKN